MISSIQRRKASHKRKPTSKCTTAGLGGTVLLTSVLLAAEMALGFLELAAEIFAHSVDAALEHKRLIQQVANEYQ